MSIKDIIRKQTFLIKIYKRLKTIIKNPLKKNINGFNNLLYIKDNVFFSNCKVNIIGNNNSIRIEDFAELYNVKIYILGNNNQVIINKKVIFNLGGSIWIENDNCEIKIGEATTFENVNLAATENNSKIIIGEDSMFAYDIDVKTGDSHSIIDLVNNRRVNYAQDVFIGNHVWVAPHVSILKGVVISPNSVVATRSVVTKKITEENVLLAGIPAKIVKNNISWNRERI